MKLKYDAIKAAKTQILDKIILKKVNDTVATGTLMNVQTKIDEANEDLWFKDDKLQEFPDDEMLEAEVEQALEEVKSYEKALNTIIKDKKTAVETTEYLRDIQVKTDEKISYNSMYKEAQQIQQGGDNEEMDMYYYAVKDQYTKASKALKTQQNKEKIDFTDKQKADFDKVMKPIKEKAEKTEKNYKASMSVKFDIEQRVAEADTELVVEVPEKVVIALKEKVKFLVKQTKDTKNENTSEIAKKELKEIVSVAYDKQARLGIKQKKEPSNKELAEEYAVARETYEV